MPTSRAGRRRAQPSGNGRCVATAGGRARACGRRGQTDPAEEQQCRARPDRQQHRPRHAETRCRFEAGLAAQRLQQACRGPARQRDPRGERCGRNGGQHAGGHPLPRRHAQRELHLLRGPPRAVVAHQPLPHHQRAATGHDQREDGEADDDGALRRRDGRIDLGRGQLHRPAAGTGRRSTAVRRGQWRGRRRRTRPHPPARRCGRRSRTPTPSARRCGRRRPTPRRWTASHPTPASGRRRRPAG